MTETEFRELQREQRECGLCLQAYLEQQGIPYSRYYYWLRKYDNNNSAKNVMAPISVKSPTTMSAHEGISVMLPNGVQIHFSPSMEASALRFLNERGGDHV